MTKDLQLLKDVLSVPTFTYKEDLMVEFLIKFFNQNNIEYFVDEHKNVYATKQTLTELPENFYFPCVISHTDTVHRIDTINIKEEMLPNAQKEIKLSYKAYNDEGNPTGIGGDDKCGVFACLSLLNVGYGIQFDAPENWMITEECFGQVLFDRDSEFFESCDKVLTEGMIKEDMDYMVHPYTDVYALRKQFDFSCINFSIGYYNYHTKNEYVVVEDVFNGADMGRRMIESLGNKLHYKKSVQNRYGRI